MRKSIASVVMMISYIMSLLTSMGWINFLPNLYYGIEDFKSYVVISAVFQVFWIVSNMLALLGHIMLAVILDPARWVYLIIIAQCLFWFIIGHFIY